MNTANSLFIWTILLQRGRQRALHSRNLNQTIYDPMLPYYKKEKTKKALSLRGCVRELQYPETDDKKIPQETLTGLRAVKYHLEDLFPPSLELLDVFKLYIKLPIKLY